MPKNCQHMHNLKQMKFWWLFMSSAQKYNQQYSTAPRACNQQHTPWAIKTRHFYFFDNSDKY